MKITFLLFCLKEAANRMGFGETVAVEGPGSDALAKRAASKFCNQPALELSKRPALIVLCAGRITVDAREKD
jgi:hypothetical protein